MHPKHIVRLGLRLGGFGLIIAAVLLHPVAAQAAGSQLNSPQFGYGALLDPLGEDVELALKASASIGLDWVGVEFDWERLWRQGPAKPDLNAIDTVMKTAQGYGLNVMLSISDAPAWAKTASGPDPETTARLVSLLSNRYKQSPFCIELFPSANTLAGWGTTPDPQAYNDLLKASWDALHSSGSPVCLVAAGLQPLSTDHSRTDMDDLTFLTGLYAAGAADYMPILGMRLTGLSGEVMSNPDEGIANVLRHYEAIRQMMVTHRHTDGMIWITGFTWPASKAGSFNEQSRWIRQAYNLMRAQLFIGVAFFDGLNPHATSSSRIIGQYLVHTEAQKTRFHPALNALGALITLDRTGQDISSRGNLP